MPKIYHYVPKQYYHSSYGEQILPNQEELMKFLIESGQLEILEYNLDNVYEAVRDVGYPFEYWKQGTKMTLEEWIPFIRKESPMATKNKSDLTIIESIITNTYNWRKIE